jgi:hypothetical protein
MNEQIKELAKQAEIKFEAHLQHFGIDTAVVTPADLEKFAELIVRECAEFVDYRLTNPNGASMAWCDGSDIKQHFGVEE